MRLRVGVARCLLYVLVFLLPAIVASQPPPPFPDLSCTELFGSAPEFVLCEETETTCSFNARMDGGTCDQMCASLGSTCVGAINNDESCEELPNNTDTCETPRNTEICICERPEDTTTPPPPPDTPPPPPPTESQPNLQPTEITFDPSTAIVGGTVFFDSGVRNTGDVDSDVFSINWFVNNQEVEASGNHAGVPAGQTVMDDNSQFSWAFDSPGIYSVTFTVDVDNHIEESNEEDNSMTIDVVVTSQSPPSEIPPPPPPGTLPPPPPVSPPPENGDPIYEVTEVTECHTYDAQQPVRAGWGAAYDLFSAEQEVLLQALCTPDEMHITVGDNNPETYIYHLGGHWINPQVQQLALQCSGEKQWGAWCVGEATAVIPVQSQYYAAYICRKINGLWKCGCRDKQCAQPFWQLQKVGMHPPAAPSNVQVEEITHEGRPSTEVSWTDNADNELGFVVVDQNRPQEFDAEPVLGIGATGSLILPFVSSFCVYAYNDFGISDAVCTGEVVAPADSFTYPMNLAQRTGVIDYNFNNPNLTRTSRCYGVPLSKTWHAGEDWLASSNTPVNAVANGVVKYSSKPGSGGTITYPGGVVIIEHRLPDQSLIYSMYAHLDPSRILVPKEAEVTKGQKIADGLCHEGDCAGNVHLHWEMRFFLDGSGINKATTEPPYTQTCSQVPGPGYTYPGHPDNFVANGGAGPTYHWTDPSNFVGTP